MAPFLGPFLLVVIVVAVTTMLDYHNLLVMSVHVAVVVTILLDNDGIFSFRRRGKWHCNSESRECGKSDGKLAHRIFSYSAKCWLQKTRVG
jgi:hypothetical protein